MIPTGGSDLGIEARLAVYDLFVLYADALDYRRWELLEEVFSADVTSAWPMGEVLEGREQMVELIQRHFAEIGPTHHLMGNFSARSDGEEILASVRIRAYHSGAGERADLFEESLGSFDARARPTADGWRFVHFSEEVFVALGSYEVFGLPGELRTGAGPG